MSNPLTMRWDYLGQDIYIHILQDNFPIGSTELRSLKGVNRLLCRIVDQYFQQNMKTILLNYLDEKTPLDCIILNAQNQHIASYSISPDFVSAIQESIVKGIQNSGVLCANAPLTLEDVSQFNQGIKDVNLQKIWGPIRQQMLSAEGLPAENASSGEIRLWMHANKDYLQGIFYLSLDGLGLTTLPPEINLLSGLRSLNLNNNQLGELYDDSFAELTQLQLLYLNDNHLTKLSENVFKPLFQLQELFLNNNQLSTLPENLFLATIELRRLYLKDNLLTELPENLFLKLIHLQNLNLSHNQLNKLPENLFIPLSALQNLQLSHNQITELPEKIFSELHHLQWLFLGNNRLSKLPESLFTELTELLELQLDKNQIKELSENLFASLTQLQKLYLDSNQLSELHENLFASLSQLQWLELTNNQLSDPPENLFASLSQLQSLYLSNNQFIQLPENLFTPLTQLHALYLNGNPQLMFLYKNIRVKHLNSIKEFQGYNCKSQFAQFYKDVAQSKPLDAVMESFFKLDKETLQNPLFGMVYEMASPITTDVQWGEHHAFDNTAIFCKALKKFVLHKFDGLSLDKKSAVYSYVSQLALEENPMINSNDALWGKNHATDNVLRLIDAMEKVQGLPL